MLNRKSLTSAIRLLGIPFTLLVSTLSWSQDQAPKKDCDDIGTKAIVREFRSSFMGSTSHFILDDGKVCTDSQVEAWSVSPSPVGVIPDSSLSRLKSRIAEVFAKQVVPPSIYYNDHFSGVIREVGSFDGMQCVSSYSVEIRTEGKIWLEVYSAKSESFFNSEGEFKERCVILANPRFKGRYLSDVIKAPGFKSVQLPIDDTF